MTSSEFDQLYILLQKFQDSMFTNINPSLDDVIQILHQRELNKEY